MEKKVTLQDGGQVVIRRMRPDDGERLFAFFASLPAEDRKYLRTDVTRRDVVERRVKELDSGRVERLVAVVGDRIVADGSLELVGHGWGDGVAEVRLIVAQPYQRRGLGTLMARELFFLAAGHRVERIVVRMMRPQSGAARIFRKLGFNEEFLIPEHVRDQSGVWQDMIIMRCNLEAMWRELEALVEETDMKRQIEERTGLG
jgi:RimJ/RimL family protein N-acetyltransferase